MAFGHLDTAPLTAPVAAADLPPRTSREVRSGLLGAAIISVLLWLFLAGFVVGLSFFPPQPWWAMIPVTIGVVLTVRLFGSALWPRPTHRENLVRVARFAAANAMTYAPEAEAAHDGPGLVFGRGVNRVTRDVVRLDEPRAIELGRQHYADGKHNAEPNAWSYATTPLAGPDAAGLPHLVLSARVRWRDIPLPGSSDLTLGTPAMTGPGTEVYTVRGPIGRAATIQRTLDTTLFRDDVLARLTERRVDVEVVDQRLYLYTPTPLVGVDPDTWRWILDLVVDIAAALEDPA